MPHPGELAGLAIEAAQQAALAALAPPLSPTLNNLTGVWIPVDNSGAGLAITVNDARYWKLGTLVIASARITYPVTASGANASLSGLPFALNANESSRQGYVTYTDAAVALYALPIVSSNQIAFATTGGGLVTNVQLSGKTIIFQAIYQTNP